MFNLCCFLVFVSLAIYIWYDRKKKSLISILLRAMTFVELVLGSKKGHEKLNLVVEHAILKLSNFGFLSSFILKHIFTKDKIVEIIETLVPKINEDCKEVLLNKNKIISDSAKKGAEYAIDAFVKKAIPLDVNGDSEITHNTQLIKLAEELKIENSDRGFVVGELGINGDSEHNIEYYAKAALGFKF